MEINLNDDKYLDKIYGEHYGAKVCSTSADGFMDLDEDYTKALNAASFEICIHNETCPPTNQCSECTSFEFRSEVKAELDALRITADIGRADFNEDDLPF